MYRIAKALLSLIILLGFPFQAGAITYTVSGAVSGLSGTVALKLNSYAPLSVKTAKFTFPTHLATGTHYSITVATQPTTQICKTSSSGTIGKANIATVAVTCAYKRIIGGTITGLNGTLKLSNENGTPQAFSSSTGAAMHFQLTTPVTQGSAYLLKIVSQPFNQSCKITTPASGAVGVSNTANVAITCSIINPYTAYITTNTSVLGCVVNPTTGAFSTCNTLYSSLGAASAFLNSAKNRAYLINGNIITQCTINTNTGSWTSCLSLTTQFTNPTGLVLTPDGKRAYVTSNNQSSGVKSGGGGKTSGGGKVPNGPTPTTGGVNLCVVDSLTGALSSCVDSGSGLSNSMGLTLNKAGTYAYVISNNGATLAVYSVAPSTYILTKIQNADLTSIPGINAKNLNLVASTSGSHLYMNSYVTYDPNNLATAQPNTVARCNVDDSTGSLSDCTPAYTPSQITADKLFQNNGALTFYGTKAYVGRSTNGGFFICSVGSNAVLVSCTIVNNSTPLVPSPTALFFIK